MWYWNNQNKNRKTLHLNQIDLQKVESILNLTIMWGKCKVIIYTSKLDYHIAFNDCYHQQKILKSQANFDQHGKSNVQQQRQPLLWHFQTPLESRLKLNRIVNQFINHPLNCLSLSCSLKGNSHYQLLQ